MKFLLFLSLYQVYTSLYSLITATAVGTVLKELPSNFSRHDSSSQSLEELSNP